MSKYTVLLLLLISPLLSSKSFAQQSDAAATELETKWQNLKAYALEIAEVMPAEFYTFKPTPEQMTFQSQLTHMARNIEKLSYSYLLPDEQPDESDMILDGKATIVQILGDAFDVGSRAHQRLSEQELDEKVSFFAGPMTKRQIRELLHAHQTHHLGQLIVYLRLKGIEPPKYVGW